MPLKNSRKISLLCGFASMVLGYSPVIYDFATRFSDQSILCVAANSFDDACLRSFDLRQLNDESDADSIQLLDNLVLSKIDAENNDQFSDNGLCEVLDNNASYADGLLLSSKLNNFCTHICANDDYGSCESDYSNFESIPNALDGLNATVKECSNGVFAGSKLVKSSININFYVDALQLRIPAKVVDCVVKSMSERIDFRRAIKKGDEFIVVYNKSGDVLYAKIKTRFKSAEIYRYKDGKKFSHFFENGEKVIASVTHTTTEAAFGRPIAGNLKITSGYGYRVHPVKRIMHYHTGVDLMARYGTPVYAVSDGVITRSSRYGNYGKCVDIAHQSGLASRYAHLSKCAFSVGRRVKKGQVIGYSGNSGLSTGPHVHFEMLQNNVAVNPMKARKFSVKQSHKIRANGNFSSFCKTVRNAVAENL